MKTELDLLIEEIERGEWSNTTKPKKVPEESELEPTCWHLRRIWPLRLYRLRRNETVDRLGRRALCPLSEQGQEGTAPVIFPATMDDMLRGGCVFLKMKECLACREPLHL
jgi:hypothetical protein